MTQGNRGLSDPMRPREGANLLSSYGGHRAFQATLLRYQISADLDGKESTSVLGLPTRWFLVCRAFRGLIIDISMRFGLVMAT